MKLKERRNFQIMARMRDILMESEKDIGVSLQPDTLFKDLKTEFSHEEVEYAIRYLEGKGYFAYHENRKGDRNYLHLTFRGYDEWLFPTGSVDARGIFMSYAIEDKVLAGQIKKSLEEEGWQVFLAHEDIEPTAEWRDRIISDLKSCYIFLALRTKRFQGKPYTEQECGFALALDKKILSLCIGTKPSDMGFCGEFQGAEFKTEKLDPILYYLKKQLGKPDDGVV